MTTTSRAKGLTRRRCESQVTRGVKQHGPEECTRIQTKVTELGIEDRSYYERLQKLEQFRLNHTLVCTGIPLPSINLRPQKVDGSLLGMESKHDEAVVVFRMWSIYSDGYLHGIGLGSRYVWKEVNFADSTPTPENDSGLYSIRLDPYSLVKTVGGYFGFYCGLVVLWGTIIEHEAGYLRSEWARILCIWATDSETYVYDHIPMLLEHYPTTPMYVCTPRQAADAVVKVMMLQEVRKRNSLGR